MKIVATLAVLAFTSIVASQPSAPAVQRAEVVGTWQQTQQMYDRNGNRTIDAEERQSARTDAAMAFIIMRLNADGTCQLGDSKSRCRYELETQSGGRQRLVLHIHMHGRETRDNRGIIHSVTKDELILANYGSGSFNVFKRTR